MGYLHTIYMVFIACINLWKDLIRHSLYSEIKTETKSRHIVLFFKRQYWMIKCLNVNIKVPSTSGFSKALIALPCGN